jgi:hypothetical protein
MHNAQDAPRPLSGSIPQNMTTLMSVIKGICALQKYDTRIYNLTAPTNPDGVQATMTVAYLMENPLTNCRKQKSYIL